MTPPDHIEAALLENIEAAAKRGWPVKPELVLALVGVAQAAQVLDDWVGRMPDAGFNSDDPRWDWWHQRPTEIRAALARLNQDTT